MTGYAEETGNHLVWYASSTNKNVKKARQIGHLNLFEQFKSVQIFPNTILDKKEVEFRDLVFSFFNLSSRFITRTFLLWFLHFLSTLFESSNTWPWNGHAIWYFWDNFGRSHFLYFRLCEWTVKMINSVRIRSRWFLFY